MRGLNGDADTDGNKRVTAGELVAYVTPRVSDWARDNRGARQVPLLLPKGDGAGRVRDMHLVSVDSPPAEKASTQWNVLRASTVANSSPRPVPSAVPPCRANGTSLPS